ncbi:hypothetical protein JL722_6619 [Aureococcus anophagefferens]|nr:hypothetical protein JL722_6619 [Aureococcus anophagefferens]
MGKKSRKPPKQAADAPPPPPPAREVGAADDDTSLARRARALRSLLGADAFAARREAEVATVVDVLRKFEGNQFQFEHGGPGVGAACALYRRVARANHSCAPSLVLAPARLPQRPGERVAGDGGVAVRTCCDVAAGEPLTICYGAKALVGWDVAKRRAYLEKHNGFFCRVRCELEGWLCALIAARAAALAPAPLKTTVVVDVDDTVKSSGNVRLAGIPLGGIDGQYDRGAFYPGMFDFAYELGAPEPVAVLTARAEEFKFALELKESDKVVAAFRDCGRRNGAAGWGVGLDRVLYGSVHEWVFQDFKGWVKFQNFERLAARLGDLPRGDGEEPARRYVFVGDTGELDGQAGEIMLARHPDLCAAVLLHCVGTDARQRASRCRRVRVNGRPVRFFRTYVMAAFHALDLGLMSEEDLTAWSPRRSATSATPTTAGSATPSRTSRREALARRH